MKKYVVPEDFDDYDLFHRDLIPNIILIVSNYLKSVVPKDKIFIEKITSVINKSRRDEIKNY